MARIRTIKPKFWDDIKLSKISRDARLLFVGMWNFADDLGVIVGDSIWIKSKVFPYDQIQLTQFERWIQELVKNGFISQLSHKGDDFYYLPNLTRHQVINRPNYDEVNIDKELLDSILQSITEQSLNDHGLISAGKEGKGKEGKGEDACASAHTNPVFDSFVKFLKKEAPDVLKLQYPFTPEELTRLLDEYPSETIKHYCRLMHNYKPLLQKSKSANLTIRKWITNDKDKHQPNGTAPTTPQYNPL